VAYPGSGDAFQAQLIAEATTLGFRAAELTPTRHAGSACGPRGSRNREKRRRILTIDVVEPSAVS